MRYREHAGREFEKLGYYDEEGRCKDRYDSAVHRDVMALLDLFNKQGHSGFSASIVRSLFNRLSNFLPLSPLTGEESEWNEHNQNIRCSHIFRRKDGTAYTIKARVFEDESGRRYTSAESTEDIEFPYTVPDKPEIVKVKGDSSEPEPPEPLIHETLTQAEDEE